MAGNSSGRQFALDLSKWVAKAKGNMDGVVAKVMLDLGTRIILRSPVRTGRFRANWQYGLSNRPTGTIIEVDKNGTATVRKLIGSVGVKDAAGKIHWLTNNLPYAQRLEYGWSKQAPSGMVGVSIVEYQQIVINAVKAVKR